MSKKEFDRLEVLTGVQAGRIRVADACKLLGLQRRQIFRLLAGLKRDGAVSLISRGRGKPSNNRLPEPFRDLALSLVRERYADFGPTLAAEKLAELHGCAISRETLRQWMIAVGLWLDRRHRLPSPHQPRRRRDRLGELVQIDGSEHAWFEDRGEACTLLAFVDDATSRLMHLRFVASESAFAYFRSTRAYLQEHGKPVAFYSDKHGIFRVNAKDAVGGDGLTQFGRALTELNIDIICANSPQAKGRVERAFGTLQDRLVKELRLAGIATTAAANVWLPGFVEAHNKRFARAPAHAKDLHRRLTEGDDLDEILAWREERTVSNNLTLHYDRMMILLTPGPVTLGLRRKKVAVVNRSPIEMSLLSPIEMSPEASVVGTAGVTCDGGDPGEPALSERPQFGALQRPLRCRLLDPGSARWRANCSGSVTISDEPPLRLLRGEQPSWASEDPARRTKQRSRQSWKTVTPADQSCGGSITRQRVGRAWPAQNP